MTKRVWDDLLSAQDKASLPPRPHQVWGFGERPALLLIDLYRWVFGDRRAPLLEAMREWPGTCGEAAWDALPHAARLLAAARNAGIPVVHATGLDPAESGIIGWAETGNGESIVYNDKPFDPDKLRSRYDIMSEVAPIPGEAVIRKIAPSAFFGTALSAHLSALHADALIIGGESTSGCVRASCVDAKSFRLRVTIAEECVFDRHQAPHAINLFDMNQKYADVLGVDEVIAHLDGLRRPVAVR